MIDSDDYKATFKPFCFLQVRDLKAVLDKKDVLLNLEIEKPEKGEKGDKGEAGSKGPSGADVSVCVWCVCVFKSVCR